MKRFNLGFGFWFGLVIIVVFGGILWYLFSREAKEMTFLEKSPTRDIALSCTTDMATQFHIHPQLKIVIDNKEQVVPTDIGISDTCMRPLHTHNETGIIHVESPVKRDFTLGDLFAVWGKPFSATQILDKTVVGTGKLTVTVNGKQVDTFDKTVFADKDQILITYSSK